MALTVGELVAFLTLDDKQFKEGMSTSKSGFGSFASNLLKTALVAGLALGAALGAGIVAFGVESVKHMEAAGHAAFEMSDKFGLAKDQASEWLVAGDALGVTNESMTTGFKFLAKNIEGLDLINNAAKMHEYHQELVSGTEKQKLNAQAMLQVADAGRPLQQVFVDLGITTHDAAGNIRPMNDLMLDAANSFAAMPDGAEKAGLAVKLFGRSGTDLIPILNEGKDGIQKLIAAGILSGAVMSTTQVDAAQKLFLAHKQLDQAVTGLANKFGTVLLPIATSFINWIMSDGIPGLERLWKTVQVKILPALKYFTDAIIAIWNVFITLLKPILMEISKHGEQFKLVLEALGVVVLIIVGIILGLVLAFALVVLSIGKVVDGFQHDMKPAFDDVNNVIVTTIGIVKDLVYWFGVAANAFSNLPGSKDIANAVSMIGGSGPAARPTGFGRAGGGQILAGWSGWVGEKGPEYVTAGGPANVHNAADSKRMGGVSLTVNNYGGVTDPEAIRRTLQRMAYLGAV